MLTVFLKEELNPNESLIASTNLFSHTVTADNESLLKYKSQEPNLANTDHNKAGLLKSIHFHFNQAINIF